MKAATSYFQVFLIVTISAKDSLNVCKNPPLPLAGKFETLKNTTKEVKLRYSCTRGYYLVGNDVISCNVVLQRWSGPHPTCAVDAALNKPAKQSSLSTVAYKAVTLNSGQYLKHRGK